MGDTTTIVVALVLVGGAIYLAARPEDAPLPVDDGPEGPGELCQVAEAASKASGYGGGGAACSIVTKVADAIKGALPGGGKTPCDASAMRQYYGYYHTRHGFTGRCLYSGNDPKKPFVRSPIGGVAGVIGAACCPPGATTDRCRRTAFFDAMPGFCQTPFSGLAPTVQDHRGLK